MSDSEKIDLLLVRLARLEQRTCAEHERPIVAVAREALQHELTELGRWCWLHPGSSSMALHA